MTFAETRVKVVDVHTDHTRALAARDLKPRRSAISNAFSYVTTDGQPSRSTTTTCPSQTETRGSGGRFCAGGGWPFGVDSQLSRSG